MNGLLRDLRHAIRVLAGSPGFTSTAILTLALGIGASVAMFSIVYGVLLRPLPYRDPDRLVMARAEVTVAGAHRPAPLSIQSAELNAWQQALDGLASTALYTATDSVALSGDHGSEVLDSAVVSNTFFATIAGPFVAGRPLDAADDEAPVAVISTRLAQRLFGGASQAIGRPLPLNRGVLAIVGVVDRTFQFPGAAVDVWMPAGFVRSATSRPSFFQVAARLESDGTVERARAALHPMFQSSMAGQRRGSDDIRTTVVGLSDSMVSAVRPALLILFTSVLMVLGIACGNLINLLLSRNAAREREFGIRRALGASSRRLVQQLLVESAVLGVAGAMCGAIVARLSLGALSRFAADVIPRLDAIHLDGLALLFAVGLAILATVLTGLTPALQAVRGATLPNQAATGTATPWRARHLQRAMCAAQVALAVMLLIGASLMGRSLVRLLNVDLGVSTDHVLTASLNLGFGGRPPDAETIARVGRVIDQVRALPGVRAVGAGTGLPPSVSRMQVTLRRSGDNIDYQAAAVPATPGYFPALQMRLIKGRFFTDADDERHPEVVIVSEATAARFFGAEDPIGRTLPLPVLRNGVNSRAEITVVGVTANVKYAGLATPPDDVVYRPFAQQPWVAPFLVVRTSNDPGDLASALRRTIAAVDKGIVVSSIATLDQLVLDEAAQPQFRTGLLTTFAALALAIATIGLYGVVAYTVSRRTREIGLRIALGATSRAVLTMVLADGLLIALVGVVIGSMTSWMLATLLSGLLYGIAPTDPVSFLVAPVVLLGVTMIASYIPARRAARIDPMGALRAE